MLSNILIFPPQSSDRKPETIIANASTESGKDKKKRGRDSTAHKIKITYKYICLYICKNIKDERRWNES